MKIPCAQCGLLLRRPCRRTGYGQTDGCGQNDCTNFTHNYLSLFCNKKGARNGARIWVMKIQLIVIPAVDFFITTTSKSLILAVGYQSFTSHADTENSSVM